MYRKLSKKGSLFITVPSAFTKTTGKKHWHTLLKARAIENFCYIIAPAQHGTHWNGRETYGHSLIVSPDGIILKELKNPHYIDIEDNVEKYFNEMQLSNPEGYSFFVGGDNAEDDIDIVDDSAQEVEETGHWTHSSASSSQDAGHRSASCKCNTAGASLALSASWVSNCVFY